MTKPLTFLTCGHRLPWAGTPEPADASPVRSAGMGTPPQRHLPSFSCHLPNRLALLLALLGMTFLHCSERCDQGPQTEARQAPAEDDQAARASEGSGQQDRTGAWALNEDLVVAWVEEEEVRRSQLDHELDRRIDRMARGGRSLTPSWRNAQRRQIVRQLVEQLLMVRALDEEGIEVSDSELAAVMDQEIQQLFGSEDRLNRYLERRGMSREEYEGWRRSEMRMERLLRSRGWREPTEQEVEEYYDQNRNTWRAPQRLRAATIGVRLGRDADEAQERAAREQIQVLREMVLSGQQDFASLAREYSQTPDRNRGGDLGWIYRDDTDLEPAVTRLLFETELNRVTEPIRTRLGYQIFLVTDRREEGARAFDEVQDHVSAHLNHLGEQAVRVRLLQELNARFDVGYHEAAYGLEAE
ncbi:MAG: peptidyl-prolyl cis-trans isomerase [Bradymonadales bacterium]|nr:peptidyl-prolyl cis-trans isomerase [Bradymonadales bacterium]